MPIVNIRRAAGAVRKPPRHQGHQGCTKKRGQSGDRWANWRRL